MTGPQDDRPAETCGPDGPDPDAAGAGDAGVAGHVDRGADAPAADRAAAGRPGRGLPAGRAPVRGLAVLARATTPGDRRRQRLLIVAVAAAGALGTAALAVAVLPAGRELPGMAPFVGEPGLRVGVVTGALLLLLPVALLGVQALRLGSAEQARRLAALRLVGATPGQLRTIAAIRTGRAGLLGGVLAGPGYLVLWVLLGALPADGFRLLPPLVPGLLAAWPGAVLLGGLAGVLTGWATAGGPRGRPSAVRRGVLPIAVAVPVVVAAATSLTVVTVGFALLAVVVAGLVVREPLAARAVRRLRRRGGAVDALVAARLAADPVAPGRVAAVLGLAGLALGIEGGVAAGAVDHENAAFYLAGVGLAGATTVVAVVVALLSLVVAAADQVVAARRAAAALGALGADPGLHRAVLRRQLTALSLPAALAGCVVGLLGYGTDALVAGGPAEVVVLLVPLPLTALLVLGAARLAVALVAGPLRAAIAPVNLRAP